MAISIVYYTISLQFMNATLEGWSLHYNVLLFFNGARPVAASRSPAAWQSLANCSDRQHRKTSWERNNRPSNAPSRWIDSGSPLWNLLHRSEAGVSLQNLAMYSWGIFWTGLIAFVWSITHPSHGVSPFTASAWMAIFSDRLQTSRKASH